ncbi:uncharacterized protein [Primulina huaijiensis]|uniref:uncharacterized protein isoform X2 n=1 Tax=Primulina huaijiensis TaxID=1492673 RepID=UPI003CC7582E
MTCVEPSRKEKKLEVVVLSICSIHGLDSGSDSGDDKFDDTNEEILPDMEYRALRKAMKESRRTRAFEEEMYNRYGSGNVGGSSSSLGANPNLRKQMPHSFSVREGVQLPSKGIDSYMFPSKRKSIKKLVCS